MWPILWPRSPRMPTGSRRPPPQPMRPKSRWISPSVSGKTVMRVTSRCSAPSKPISRHASTWCRLRPAATPTRRRCFRRWAGAGGIGRVWPRTIMENNTARSCWAPRFSLRNPHPAALVALAAVLSGGSCTSRVDNNTTTVTASNVRLTAAQRQHIQLYTVAPSRFRRTIEATGAVDFDNDQATSVLAPFSGPVSRLLVAQGDEVRKDDALAIVDSPDFATAISTYQKTLATARTDRRLADLDKDLVQHNGVSQREFEQAQTDAANAEADRDAALRALVSLNIPPKSIEAIRDGRSVSAPEGIIRSPVDGTVVERLITPG